MHPRKPSLPVELWCLAFADLPLRDRLSVMRVCRAWREIALDAKSALWAQIRWNSGACHLNTLKTRFRLAPLTLVDLQIKFSGYHALGSSNRPYQFVSILHFFEECIPRLRSLDLHASQDMPQIDFDSISETLSTARAPHLESFTLKACIRIYKPLFSGDCPKLRHMSLEGVSLDSDARYPAVTTLVYSFAVVRLPASINFVLTHFPNIEVLKLDTRSFKTSDNPSDELPVWPRPFRTLMLSCEYWWSLPLKLMHSISHGSIGNVEYVLCVDSNLKYFPTEVELVLFSDLQTPELHAGFQTYKEWITPMFELCFEDKAGFRRVFDAPHKVDTPHVVFAQDLTQGLLNMISILDINERDMVKLLLSRSARVELSNLARLNLYLFDDREHREGRNWRTPFLVDDEYSVIVPQLTEVHFTAQDISWFAPEMVSRFVHRQLDRGPQACEALNRIGFHNVRLLQNHVDAVASMLLLAADFQFTLTPLTWISAKINELPEDVIDYS